MGHWKKLGRIFEPKGQADWIQKYAWVPTAECRGGDIYRIYFGGRNKDNLSQTGYIEIDIYKPSEILKLTERPVLALGKLGAFDDSLVLPSWIVDRDEKKYMYYIGWMQGRRVPYYAGLGLAVSLDGGESFVRCSAGPLIPRDSVDPYMTASACVLYDEGRWRMWYLSNTIWRLVDGEPLPRYHLRYAESVDGFSWDRKGIVAIDFKSDDEFTIARPCVIRDGDIYKMWYCFRGAAYRIGYAESRDGISWTRKDGEVGIDVSSSGWDSEMVAYPFVFDHGGQRYMLYNGNNFGETGMGLAVFEA
jgi:hypothetical protein